MMTRDALARPPLERTWLVKIKLPSEWVSYIFNGDRSGMEDADVAEADAELARLERDGYRITDTTRQGGEVAPADAAEKLQDGTNCQEGIPDEPEEDRYEGVYCRVLTYVAVNDTVGEADRKSNVRAVPVGETEYLLEPRRQNLARLPAAWEDRIRGHEWEDIREYHGDDHTPDEWTGAAGDAGIAAAEVDGFAIVRPVGINGEHEEWITWAGVRGMGNLFLLERNRPPVTTERDAASRPDPLGATDRRTMMRTAGEFAREAAERGSTLAGILLYGSALMSDEEITRECVETARLARRADACWRMMGIGRPNRDVEAGDWRVRLVPAAVGLVAVTLDPDHGSVAANAVHDAMCTDPVTVMMDQQGRRCLWYRRSERTNEQCDGCWTFGSVHTHEAVAVEEPRRLQEALQAGRGQPTDGEHMLAGFKRRGRNTKAE